MRRAILLSYLSDLLDALYRVSGWARAYRVSEAFTDARVLTLTP